MDLRKLKEKATEAFTKGKFAKAAELYEVYCAGDAKDLQARLRMGDAFAKAGAKEKAIGAYKFAAESFAREGFLPRAIAASKLILELDPTHRGVQQMLADLYAKRGASEAKKRPTTTTTQMPAVAVPASPPAAASYAYNVIELPAEEPSPAPPPPAPAAGPNATSASAPKAFELPDDGGLTLELDSPATAPAPGEVSLEIDNSAELPLELALPEAPPARPPPQAQAQPAPPQPAPVEEVEEVEEIIADVVPETPVPAQPVLHVRATPASGGAAPPGMKPKRITSEIPIQAAPPPEEPVVELTVKKPAPNPAPAPAPAPIPAAAAPTPVPPPAGAPKQAGRIWLPETFTPPPGATPPPPPAASAKPAPSLDPAVKKGSSDLEAGLAALSRFDELDLDMAPAPSSPAPAAAAQVAPPEPTPAQAPPTPAPRGMPSFTELELQGDSLLHAVEMAAQVGISQRAEPAAPEGERSAEESMSSVAEDFQGESKTPAGLPKIPLFSDLSADAFIELFDRCPLRRFGQDERILDQGSVGDSFFVICAGAVRVVRQEENGQQKELAILQEGAFFGEVALLSGAPRTASVISHAEETQLLEISATVLAQLSHRYPQVAAALKKFCRQRLLANVMNSSPLFKPFSRKDRKDLVERFRARDVQKSDIVIREGKPSDGLYVVLSGEVVVRKGEVRLATLREGEIFGEMSLLQKQPATATVAAAKRTSLLRLPREAFDQIILTHPQVLMLVSDLSESRQRHTAAALSGELLV